jgi:hypothetical protein
MASWTPAWASAPKPKPVAKSSSKEKRVWWNAIAKQQLMIHPESIATITVVSQCAPSEEAMYLEGIALKRGSDSFVQVPDRLIDLDANDSFQVKIANTMSRRIIVRSGELLGHLYKACDTLKAVVDTSPLEIRAFEARASHLANLANKLNPRELPSETAPLATDLAAQLLQLDPEWFCLGWSRLKSPIQVLIP